MAEGKAAAQGLLGLARRAGKLFVGAGPVLRALEKEKAGVVFLANDAGRDVRRKIERSSGESLIFDAVFAGEELAALCSRDKVSVVSVHEPDFVKGIRKALANQG